MLWVAVKMGGAVTLAAATGTEAAPDVGTVTAADPGVVARETVVALVSVGAMNAAAVLDVEDSVGADVAEAGVGGVVTNAGAVAAALVASLRSTAEFTMAAAVPATNTPLIDRMVATRPRMGTLLWLIPVADRTDRPVQGRAWFIQETSKNFEGLRQRPLLATTMEVVRILLVEDDRAIASSLVEGLVADGHEVSAVSTGSAALAGAEAGLAPEMVLLDLGLPDMDGRDVCRQLRQRTAVPIIMLTARGDEIDRVLGLELGADDYVTKPFSLRELLARIRAVGRRSLDGTMGANEQATSGEHDPAQQVGPLTIDRRTRRVSLNGTELTLTAKEFDVLAYLATDIGAVRTRTDILEDVWDVNWYGPTKTVDAHVAALRKKLGDRRWIEAVRGVGFRLELPT
ncbi:hypothetical protein BH24ACT5_BH24ACT5_08810 [soil metagenome]